MEKIISLVQNRDNTYSVEIDDKYVDILTPYKDRILQTAMTYIQTVRNVNKEPVILENIEKLVNITYTKLLKDNNLTNNSKEVIN